ncbi:hypothetical protein AGMMS49938_09230 [Fibrobacterales bacterium]|nr:hypothetical protein AGMMS49938_09230 [Fibrobacterales bacterium]
MRRATLETLLDRACLFGLCGFEKGELANVLPKLAKEKRGVVIDPRNEKLFERKAGDYNFKEINENWCIIEGSRGVCKESGGASKEGAFGGVSKGGGGTGAANFEFPKENDSWVKFYANLSALERKFQRVCVLIDYGMVQDTQGAAKSIAQSCVLVIEKDDLKLGSIDDLLRLKIAKDNAPDTPLFLSAKFAWIFAIIISALPFFVASEPEILVSNLRNLEGEAKKYADDADIVHIFRGDETFSQIARFAIGKYNSLVANEKMVNEYLKENGFSAKSSVKKGDTLKLKLPTFVNTNHKSLAPAWSFFTGLLNDSLSYITDLYNERETATQRRHNGIDLGAKRGTRILSPFSGVAYTMEDERGGLMLAVVHEKNILIFMHCEQRFYLNEQPVMAGDPIASVGTSGHTTGPHTHITAGLIDKNGERTFGKIRYREIDPFKWYEP